MVQYGGALRQAIVFTSQLARHVVGLSGRTDPVTITMYVNNKHCAEIEVQTRLIVGDQVGEWTTLTGEDDNALRRAYSVTQSFATMGTRVDFRMRCSTEISAADRDAIDSALRTAELPTGFRYQPAADNRRG